jgi:hypothetical protein
MKMMMMPKMMKMVVKRMGMQIWLIGEMMIAIEKLMQSEKSSKLDEEQKKRMKTSSMRRWETTVG